MRITVGRIGRPHGIRGDVTVEVRTDEPERYFQVDGVVTVDGHAVTIARVRWQGSHLVLGFVGVDDRDEAEALRNSLMMCERDDDETPEDPNEFYDAALIGCDVFDTAGTRLGSVADVLHLPAQDVLVVVDAEDREHLVPFITEFVPDVSVKEGRVVIAPPEGLLDS